MKDRVREFFEENPEEKYFYPSKYARVPNPDLYWHPDFVHEPWPPEGK